MLAWLMIGTALAGTVEIEVKVEGQEARHVFVDGKHRGEARPGKPVRVNVATGRHEVAVGYESDARWLVCFGEVDARRDVQVEVAKSACTAISKAPEAREKDTVREGGFVTFTGAGANGTVEISGRRHSVKPGMGIMANVPDGTHDVKGPGCEGKVTVKGGAIRAVAMADGTCVGLDAKKKGKKGKKK